MSFSRIVPLAQQGLPIDLPGGTPTLIGAAVVGLLVLWLLMRLLFGRKKPIDPEANLDQTLAELPPPPKGPRHYQLKVMNLPVRLRYVVVAPVGKRPLGKVDSVLEQVFRGLGEVSIDDKPRVRPWPARCRWRVRARPSSGSLAGRSRTASRRGGSCSPARPAAGGAPVLLGLAVLTDAPTRTGLLTMTETEWGEVLDVENA
ncbi:MAG: hypothetical protein U0736_26335 [Gemmataceae bacterium]